jgi:hypothetical protein
MARIVRVRQAASWALWYSRNVSCALRYDRLSYELEIFLELSARDELLFLIYWWEAILLCKRLLLHDI